jgi:hypothetical protein
MNHLLNGFADELVKVAVSAKMLRRTAFMRGLRSKNKSEVNSRVRSVYGKSRHREWNADDKVRRARALGERMPLKEPPWEETMMMVDALRDGYKLREKAIKGAKIGGGLALASGVGAAIHRSRK